MALVIAAVSWSGVACHRRRWLRRPSTRRGAYKYTGAASCGASNCHGSTKPKADFPKLNENIVWFQKDKHAKAYATLTNEKLKSGVSPSKIATNLKIAKAEASGKCLVCHAVDVKPELRGPKFDISEGVHCDGCHGPAEKWLEPHAEKGWTHEQSVKLGMYDTKNFLLRAEKCVSCHLQIDARDGGGRPPRPAGLRARHVQRDDAAALARQGHVGGHQGVGDRAGDLAARGGQAARRPRLRQRLGRAAQRRAGQGAGPRRGRGVLLGVAAPDAQKSVQADIAALADAVGKGDKAKVAATAKNLQSTMNAQAAKVAGREFDEASTKKLLTDIVASGDAIGGTGVRGAEQAAMALDRLYSAYSKAPGKKADKPAGEALDRMFGTIEDPKKFDAQEVRDRGQGLRRRDQVVGLGGGRLSAWR